MMHDQKCEDLAKHFLASEGRDGDEDIQRLAKWIQGSVEMFFFAEKQDEKPVIQTARDPSRMSTTERMRWRANQLRKR